MTFSIIIPSYNEGEDVRLAIESALDQSVAPLEVLVVDDSSDATPAIIKEYEPRGVHLIPGEGAGCCSARNLGMRRAKGDVVVLLNADVQLPSDFLEKISVHYENGADYVLVESEVMNQNDALAAFVEAQHRLEYAADNNIEWTEGFSVRRSTAAAVGFIPGEFKARFCRDWMLGKRLGEEGFKKAIDRSVVAKHRAPAKIGEYWRVRAARGLFGALTQHYMYGRSRMYLSAKFVLKHGLRLLALVTLVYPLIHSAQLARRSPHPIGNILPFFVAYVLQEFARAAGEWRGVIKIR